MTAVLMSIKPKWCELIAIGKKTIEVRKTKPNLETPFKVYIYCTKNEKKRIGHWLNLYCESKQITTDIRLEEPCYQLNGKVIGEFVCDEISEHNWLSYRGDYGVDKDFLSKACLNYKNMREYGKEEKLYGWHISDLVIYDNPKELSEFRIPCRFDFRKCENCKYDSWDYSYGGGKDRICAVKNSKPMTRPPQSWCYVERSDSNAE